MFPQKKLPVQDLLEWQEAQACQAVEESERTNEAAGQRWELEETQQ